MSIQSDYTELLGSSLKRQTKEKFSGKMVEYAHNRFCPHGEEDREVQETVFIRIDPEDATLCGGELTENIRDTEGLPASVDDAEPVIYYKKDWVHIVELGLDIR